MRRADRRQKRHDEEETKDQIKSVPTSGYVSMHSKDDAPSPPTKARSGEGEAAADG